MPKISELNSASAPTGVEAFPLVQSGETKKYTLADVFDTWTAFDPNASTVARTYAAKVGEIVSLGDFGVVGDGVTNDAAAIQAAMDYCETLVWAELIIPPPDVQYYLGTTSISVPNCVWVRAQGGTGFGGSFQQFKYTGTDAAFKLKADATDVRARAMRFSGIGVELGTGVGATGFRFRRVRDMLVEHCSVLFGANDQIAFHLKGNRDGFTNGTCTDNTFIRCRAYDTAGTKTGCIQWKLEGVANDGQCNANLFLGIGGGGSGTGIEVGPSYNNTFVNIEFEACSDNYIKCLADADCNSFYDMYAGDVPAGFTGYAFLTETGATRNRLIGYRHAFAAGNNEANVSLVATNYAETSDGVRYVADGDAAYSIGVEGDDDDYPRLKLKQDGIYIGQGTAEAVRPSATNTLTLAASITPDAALGTTFYLNIDAATDPTFESITNYKDGDLFTFEIVNNSGSTRTMTWHANYIRNDALSTSITNGYRYSVMFRKRGTASVIVGKPVMLSAATIKDSEVVSGTWTPTLTNTTNITSSSASNAVYTRIGNTVTFSGTVAIQPTAAAPTVTLLGISLPIAATLSTSAWVNGVATEGSDQQVARLLGDTVNNRISMSFNAQTTTNRSWAFSGQYRLA